jgi:hypothetical protein
MVEESPHAKSSAELWRLLETTGGLLAGDDDYDRPLVDELRARLELPLDIPMEEALDAKNVTTEEFVDAFFHAVEPYVAMWSDLLALFERAAATTGDQNLRIDYRFGAASSLKLRFDLEHFRRVVEQIALLRARFDLRGDHVPSEFWAITRVVDVGWGPWTTAPTDVLERFRLACGPDSEAWPSELPQPPQSGDQTLDGLVNEAWMLFSAFLGALRAISRNHASLMRLDDQQRAAVVLFGATAAMLGVIESDYWLPTTVVTLSEGIRRLAPGQLQQVADDLDDALRPLRNLDPSLTAPSRRLAEFLQLPIWKHRYELYSNWVCAQVVAALDDAGPLIHAVDGAILFSFSGTHLATFDGFRPRLHVWTELRAPLDDPVGEGRTNAIQPDITLVADPITASRSPLAVECKQYKKASNKKFANALTDYAHGRTKAHVVLVNYGRARAENILPLVAADVQSRAHVIGDLRPGMSASVSAFQDEVRTAVGKRPFRQAVEQARPVLAQLVLRWGAQPSDLDLHVLISSPELGEVEVYYQNQGDLDEAPYCELEKDVTTGVGPEVVRISRWLPATYTVTVDNYSEDAPLAGSGATVELERNGTVEMFRCPDDLSESQWTVCSIDGSSGEISEPT